MAGDIRHGHLCARLEQQIGFGRECAKNWDDLLDPKWKGAVGIWVNPFPFADLVPVLGEAKVTEYLKKLMQNDPVVIRAGGEIPAALRQERFRWP